MRVTITLARLAIFWHLKSWQSCKWCPLQGRQYNIPRWQRAQVTMVTVVTRLYSVVRCVQNHKAETACSSSKQLLPFEFAGQHGDVIAGSKCGKAWPMQHQLQLRQLCYYNSTGTFKDSIFALIKGVVHCVRTAGHICTQKAPRTLIRERQVGYN